MLRLHRSRAATSTASSHDALRVATGIAAGRVVIGASILLAPRLLGGTMLRHRAPSDEAVMALRMAGGRDLALGLGVLLAARHSSDQLRGWVEAGALADATDVYAFGRATTLRWLPRWGSVAVAAVAAALGTNAARQL